MIAALSAFGAPTRSLATDEGFVPDASAQQQASGASFAQVCSVPSHASWTEAANTGLPAAATRLAINRNDDA